MKILIMRHGDPDYNIDSLTETGKIEAQFLAERISKLDIKQFYVSPLGRARHTADYTLNKMGRTATVCDWLKEFPIVIKRPDRERSVAWDWRPKDWTVIDEFYDKDKWHTVSNMKDASVKEYFNSVTEQFDALLKKHGYERTGRCYKAVNPNEDTIALFCHFGIECVLLSHLLNVSPMILWQGFCAAPTSVTTVITEEREKGIASFRINGFGDTSHLYANGQEPSFAARFCETYDNFEQRHD